MDLWDGEFWSSTCVGERMNEWMQLAAAKKEISRLSEENQSYRAMLSQLSSEYHKMVNAIHLQGVLQVRWFTILLEYDDLYLLHECGQHEIVLVILFWCFLLVFGRRPRWPFQKVVILLWPELVRLLGWPNTRRRRRRRRSLTSNNLVTIFMWIELASPPAAFFLSCFQDFPHWMDGRKKGDPHHYNLILFIIRVKILMLIKWLNCPSKLFDYHILSM